jgi:hypothetical protein
MGADVSVSDLHVRLLQRATDKLGGTEEVARYLQVPEVRIRIWMRGLICPSDDIFLRLVDLLQESPGAPTRSGTAAPAGRAPGAGS